MQDFGGREDLKFCIRPRAPKCIPGDLATEEEQDCTFHRLGAEGLRGPFSISNPDINSTLYDTRRSITSLQKCHQSISSNKSTCHPSSPSVVPASEEALVPPDFTDFKALEIEKPKSDLTKQNHSISKAEKIANSYTHLSP
ncbi:hypothetical protein AVEN_77683-1 [Araneus ventricosus]|uniref:Uncharacterized protein n=1 Tax=Araneus ventricosus TaxID=182803 RepID=A0A4Y2T2H3_ARAVE|nr:hypothetical protein AVEN_77683-1 [Araneus ventricosus]